MNPTRGKPCACPEIRIVGVEVQGVYDGALYWTCRDCGARWHRWGEGHPLRATAEPYVSGPATGGEG